jgi:hypothetical protein
MAQTIDVDPCSSHFSVSATMIKALSLSLSKLVREDPKLWDDKGKIPKHNKLIGGLITDREMVSLLDEKPTRWSSVSCVPKKKKERKKFVQTITYALENTLG